MESEELKKFEDFLRQRTNLWFSREAERFKKEGAEMVTKPWGLEVWLHQPTEEEMFTGLGYCYKRIYLNAGQQTSLQYHEKKSETNYIIKGRAEVWLQDSAGKKIERINGNIYRFSVKKRGANHFFDVVPPRVHRIKALTNLVLQEVSNPFVKDVIRLKDDAGRGHGKIESEHNTK